MPEEFSIKVEGVSKKFARSLKRAMWYGLSDMMALTLLPQSRRSPDLDTRITDARAKRPTAGGGGAAAFESELRPSEFWALRDISFTLKPGESLGLLGANGAGKSTLFSILSGIYSPTYGRALYRGQLQALIALGAGFHPALSGRENVYINGAILGLRQKELDAIYDQIVDFAGIADFMDAPIRSYSSGMVVRLAFSIAVHLDPDVLLIDEVLAVGDASFQLKCARFARTLTNSGKTLVVVSHNMLIIQMMCRQALWLDRGRMIKMGDTHEVSKDYQRYMLERDAAEASSEKKSSSATFSALILGVEWLDAEGRRCDRLAWGRPHSLAIDFEAFAEIDCARLWLQIGAVGKEGSIIAASMFSDGHYMKIKKGRRRVVARLDALPLAQDNLYQVSVGIRDWSGHVMLSDSYASNYYSVNEHGILYRGGLGSNTASHGTSPLIAVPYEWIGTEGVDLSRT